MIALACIAWYVIEYVLFIATITCVAKKLTVADIVFGLLAACLGPLMCIFGLIAICTKFDHIVLWRKK